MTLVHRESLLGMSEKAKSTAHWWNFMNVLILEPIAINVMMKLMMTIPDLLRQLHGAGLSSHSKCDVFWGQNHILHNGLQQQVVMMVMIMIML